MDDEFDSSVILDFVERSLDLGPRLLLLSSIVGLNILIDFIILATDGDISSLWLNLTFY